MPALSDILINQAAQNQASDVTTDIQKGVSTGVELATMQEQVTGARQKIEMQRAQINQAKMATAGKFFDRLHKAQSPAERGRLLKVFKPVMANLGAPMSDAMAQELQHDEETLNMTRQVAQEFFKDFASNPKSFEALQQLFVDQFGPKEGLAVFIKATKEKKARQAQLEKVAKEQEFKVSKLDAEQKVKAKEDFFTKRAKDEFKRLADLDTVKGFLNSDGPISESAAQFMLAKAVQGAGVLTDNDVKRLGGSKSLENRITTLITEAKSGNLSSRDAKELGEIAKLMEFRIKKSILDKADKFATATANALSKEPEAIKEVLELPTIDKKFEQRIIAEEAALRGELGARGVRKNAMTEAEQKENVKLAIAGALKFNMPPEMIKQKIEARIDRPLTPEELQLLGGNQTATVSTEGGVK